MDRAGAAASARGRRRSDARQEERELLALEARLHEAHAAAAALAAVGRRAARSALAVALAVAVLHEVRGPSAHGQRMLTLLVLTGAEQQAEARQTSSALSSTRSPRPCSRSQ